jgi:hypothetical protein
MLKKLFILFSCSLLIVQQAKSQNQTWEVGAGGGLGGPMYNSFPDDFIYYAGPFAAINLKRNFNGYWSARVDALAAQMDLSASTTKTIIDVSLLGEFNFLDYRVEESKSPVSPYLLGGAAVPVNEFEGLKSTKLVFGAGVKYNPIGRWNLIGEYRYRFGFPFNSVMSNYKFASLGLSYTFVNKKCPTVITNRKRRWGFLR